MHLNARLARARVVRGATAGGAVFSQLLAVGFVEAHVQVDVRAIAERDAILEGMQVEHVCAVDEPRVLDCGGHVHDRAHSRPVV